MDCPGSPASKFLRLPEQDALKLKRIPEDCLKGSYMKLKRTPEDCLKGSYTEEKEIRKQIEDYHRYADLIARGNYYRLNELGDGKDFSAWMFAARDGGEALVNLVMTHTRANGPFPFVKLRGLISEARYRLEETGRIYSGAALMYGGYSFPLRWGDYTAYQLHFIRE